MVWGIFKKDSISDTYKKMQEARARLTEEDTEQDTAITPAAAAKAKKPTNKKTEPITPNDVKEDYEDETAITPADAKKKKKKEVKEDVEALDEIKMADLPVRKVQGRAYGAYKPESDYVKGPSDKELIKIENEKKKKKKNEDLDIFSERELDMLINEVLSKNASAGDWIHDFVHSDNPKFDGKSKEQRKKMALGAYYGAQRNESTDYETYIELDEEKQGEVVKKDAEEIKHANMKDKQDDQEIMEPHSGTEQKFIDAHTIRVTDDPTRVKQDAGKVRRAVEPKGKGPGNYDAKEKLGDQKDGIKEATFKTEAGETIDTTPGEKKDTSGKVKGKKIAGDDNDHS